MQYFLLTSHYVKSAPIQIIKIENGLLFKPQNLSFLKDFVIVFIF